MDCILGLPVHSRHGSGLLVRSKQVLLVLVDSLWDQQGRVKDLMLQSYRAMGYISKESGELVKEVTRLMPASIGESHDIGPDEFIRELYTLNRILDPADMSLDRDMIEVLMEQQRRNGVPQKGANSVDKESQEDWVRMLDGV
jgi:hypothetical protein